MADKRPFAKIDTGYALNPKWFQVERSIRERLAQQDVEQTVQRTVQRNAIRAAREAHLFSILYCAQNVTDGFFPVDIIKALATIQTEEEEAAITALFEVGLWINHPGGMAEVRDYLEHQTSSEQVKAKSASARKAGKASAASRARKQQQAAGRSTPRSTSRSTDRSTPRSTEEKRKEEKKATGADRADILDVLDHLDKRLQALDVKAPNRNKTNIDAIRLLIDKDGRTVPQIKQVINFALNNNFWKGNIHSPKALRKSFDRLLVQSRSTNASGNSFQPPAPRVLEVGTPEWEAVYGEH